MRTIKFRGKRLDNGEWVYGDLLLNNGSSIIVIQVKRDYIGTTDVGAGKHWHIETPAYRVDIKTIGQFTGLHDKNGKEIYDGDILKSDFGSGQPAQIAFGEYKDYTNDITDKATLTGFYWVEKDGQTSPFGKSINGNMNYCEVIGNIYENPELL